MYNESKEDAAIEKVFRNESGQLHRLDGPAIIRPNGDQEWLVNGLHHRVDGPAIIRIDRGEWWWIINGAVIDVNDIYNLARNYGFSMQVPLCEEFQAILALTY